MKFEKKYVIVGEIFFSPSDAEIQSVSEEKMCSTKEEFDRFIDKVEDDGADYTD